MTDPEPIDVDAEQDALDELGRKIRDVRRKADDDLGEDDGEQHFVDSGSIPGDDQTIAP